MDRTIAGRYVLHDELGSGGMGTVYRGLDSVTGQTVAIKQLKSQIAQSDNIERFKREGEALRDLNHPNIVKMLDTVEEDGNYYLVMEHVSGGDLTKLIAREPIPVETVLRLAIDLADALTRAHKLNIIHRDLKPANVLIGEDHVLRLTDFGVAHLGGKARITDTDAIVGTIDYLPPEAFRGETIDARSDIWAFGVMLYEMLTGQKLFPAASVAQVVHAILTAPLPDLEAHRPDAPIALVDLIYRMLERDPQARVSTVRHVGAALEDISQGHEQTVPQPTRFETPIIDFRQRPKSNLPVQITPFVGREAELAELARLLNNPAIRFISILAQGGMGKTRLSLQAAECEIPNFEDGVYFVELAPLPDVGSMIPAIARGLNYQFPNDGRDPREQLFDFLAPKHLLLLLDNFEHLLDGSGLVTELLQSAPKLKIMVTSRQRLDQAGETLFHLSGMDFPTWETPEDALNYAAVKLFMNSAIRAKPDFVLNATNLDAVARICRLVEGMPLGIVLAASWLGMLSPQEIADEMTSNIDFLESDARDVPERQRSMRVVFDYSWNLLNDAEKQVLMKLSVFRGGFTRASAETVAGANLRVLMALVNKSLIRRDAESGRYTLHELLRQNGERRLLESGEPETTHNSHAHFFGMFLGQQLLLLKGAGQITAINQIENEYDNCHAAWVWAVQQRNSDVVNQMIDSLHLYLTFRYWYDQGIKLFQLARAQWSVSAPAAPLIAGRVALRFPDTSASVQRTSVIENGLSMAQKEDNLPEIAFCQRELGIQIGHRTSDKPEIIRRGLEILEISLQNYRTLGDKFYIARLLDDIGWCYSLIGDNKTRMVFAKESLEMRQAIGDVIGFGDAVPGYFFLLRAIDPEQGLRLLEETYNAARQVNNRISMAMSRGLMGISLFYTGDFDQSWRYHEEGLELARQVNYEMGIIVSQLGMAQILCIRGDDYDRAWQIIQSALPEEEKIRSQYAYMVNGSIAYILYYASVGDYASLEKSMRSHWGFLGQSLINPAAMGVLPVVSMLLASKGQKERAVTLLGLTLTYDGLSPLHYWQALTEFQASLKNELGTDTFDAVLAHGKSLNLETVLQELLDEFGTEDES